MVKDGKLYTPFADACLHGITRGLVIEIAKSLSIPIEERNLSLVDFYNADEVFATGTMGELTPVVEIDGRKVENMNDSQVRKSIHENFLKAIPEHLEHL